MLDIGFYSNDGKPPITIDVSEALYQWLIRSDFAEIGVAHPHSLRVDDEEIVLDVVDLNKGTIRNRQRFRDFLVEAIARESNDMLIRLGVSPSKKAYLDATYNLRKLQALRACIEDESYCFLHKA